MCLKCKAKQHPGMQPSGSKQQIAWHASNRSRKSMIYIQITSKQCSAIQPSEEMHENQWQGNNIRSRMLENSGTWIFVMTFTAKLRQLEPSHTSRHGKVHFYAAVPSTGGSVPKMQKKILEFGIFWFLDHFLPFQNGFGGREGFTNDPEPYGSTLF